MEEVIDERDERGDSAEAAEDQVDLSGVHPELHFYVKALGGTDRVIDSAKRVHLNKDGSVIVKLLKSVPVKVRGLTEEHDRVRFRPLRVRDYRNGIAIEAESEEFDAILKLGHALANPTHQAVIDEIENIDDMRALYFGVQLARKNFSRPMSSSDSSGL